MLIRLAWVGPVAGRLAGGVAVCRATESGLDCVGTVAAEGDYHDLAADDAGRAAIHVPPIGTSVRRTEEPVLGSSLNYQGWLQARRVHSRRPSAGQELQDQLIHAGGLLELEEVPGAVDDLDR